MDKIKNNKQVIERQAVKKHMWTYSYSDSLYDWQEK